MSETCQLSVESIEGNELRATLSLCHPDESVLWVSKAAIACLLQQIAENTGASDFADELADAGFYFDQETYDDEGLTKLNRAAEKFIASLDVSPVRGAAVTKTATGAVRVVREPSASESPRVELVVKLNDTSLLAHLEKGYRFETIQSQLGPFPE